MSLKPNGAMRRRCQRLMGEYLGAEMGRRGLGRLEGHIVACPACRSYLAELAMLRPERLEVCRLFIRACDATPPDYAAAAQAARCIREAHRASVGPGRRNPPS